MLAAYVYAFMLGLSCFLNPFINYHYSFTSPTSLSSARCTAAVAASQLSICVLPLVYFIDAALAASPFRWCCMRGIPPKNVIQHHAPFIAGMLPSAALTIFAKETFAECLIACPTACTYMSSGCLTSFNEALWVASSFFPMWLIEHKIYRVGQKLTALLALSQFIVIGGFSAAVTCASLVFAIRDDFALTQAEVAAAGSHIDEIEDGRRRRRIVVRICMLMPTFAFFMIVPFVQVPLWKGAFQRFKEALKRPSPGTIRRACSNTLLYAFGDPQNDQRSKQL